MYVYSRFAMFRTSDSTNVHGCSIGSGSTGFWWFPCGLLYHCHQRRSRLAWCSQNTGSAGDVTGLDIVPPTQPCTDPWIPLISPANSPYDVLDIASGVIDAIDASCEPDPGERITVMGPVGVLTVGRTSSSQSGNSCSSGLVQSQYGMHTSGWYW